MPRPSWRRARAVEATNEQIRRAGLDPAHTIEAGSMPPGDLFEDSFAELAPEGLYIALTDEVVAECAAQAGYDGPRAYDEQEVWRLLKRLIAEADEDECAYAVAEQLLGAIDVHWF